ncbi:RsiV family protein [soil metagenome]
MRIVIAAATLAGALSLGTLPVANAQPVCADFGGTVGADQMCTVHVENSTYMLDMNFPVDYPDQVPLTDYLTQTRDGFVNVAQMPGSTGLPYALDVTGTRYDSGTPTDGTKSVVLEVYQNVGGAHPSTWYQSFNYDLATKAPITFDTLFVPDAKPLDVIFPLVQQDLATQSGIADPVDVGDGMNPENYQNFALGQDEITFFFSQGGLMAEAAGATKVTIPRSAVAPLLAPDLA